MLYNLYYHNPAIHFIFHAQQKKKARKKKGKGPIQIDSALYDFFDLCRN